MSVEAMKLMLAALKKEYGQWGAGHDELNKKAIAAGEQAIMDSEKRKAGVAHELYTQGDKDRPDVICDRNGSVTLALCKRCGKGEGELLDPCVLETKKQKVVGKIIGNDRDGEPEVLWEGPLPVDSLLYINQSSNKEQKPIAWLYIDFYGQLKLSEIWPRPHNAFPVVPVKQQKETE